MRVAAVLAAFVAGTGWLQQQATLPSMQVLGCTATLAVAAWSACGLLMRRAASGAASAKRTRTWALLGASLAAFALGAAHGGIVAATQLADELAFEDEGRDVEVTGMIASLPAQLVRGMRFEFDVQSVITPQVHVPAKLSLGWYAPSVRVRPGEKWRLMVRLRRPHGARNPGGFDLEAWMLERGLRASGYVRDTLATPPVRVVAMDWHPAYAVDRLRDTLRERMQARLQDARYGGVLVALVLGDQRAIGEEDWRLFNQSGIAHLVSISGLHITMIAGLVALAVRALWRRSPRALAFAPAQVAAAAAAMLGALAYCLLAGWGVPAQRTFFMLATVASALVLRLRTRPATTLAMAAALVIALDPWAVLAPGFWLSFGAVAAIFHALHGRPPTAAGWRRHLLEGARTQWVVTVALLPLTVVLFQQVSLVSPLANAVAIPLVSLIVTPLALVAASCVALPAPLAAVADPLLALAHALFAWLAALLGWMVQGPAAAVAVAAPPVWCAALAVLATIWMLAPPGWPLRWAAALWLLPLFLWPAERPRAGELWVTALDVGQGAALVVETAGGVLVYDSGPRYSPQADAGSRIVLPYLRWRGIRRVELLVLSHLDSDHSGGAASLLAGLDVVAVRTSIDAEAPILSQARQVARCLAGDRERLGAAVVLTLHPTAAEYALPARNTNARSCVVEVSLDRWHVLLTGDLPAAQERGLVAREARLRADLVTAPHHGSRNSSSDPFVSVVAPRWVMAQAGYRNRFGHPDPQVVARFVAAGAEVLRTDHAGAVQWRFNADGTVTLRRERIDGARYWHNQPGLRAAATRAQQADSEADEDDNASQSAPAETPAPRD